MKQISNKTLTFLLIAAVVVSIGGTIISVNRLNQLRFQIPRITGLGSTGYVNVTIAGVTSINLIDTQINFGSCSPNATTGTNVSSNVSDGWGAPGVCRIDGDLTTNEDNITIQNDGNKNINVSVKTSVVAGTSFIGGTNPQFYFITRNASNRLGCFNVTGHEHTTQTGFDGTTGTQLEWKSFAAADTEYLACANLTYGDSNDQFSLFALLFLPPDTPIATGQNATLIFTARSWG